jgi:peptidoglycan DL-endopeptidase RipB
LVLVIAAAALSLGAALSASPIGYAGPDDGWDPSLPKLLSAGAPGDPVAIANASL